MPETKPIWIKQRERLLQSVIDLYFSNKLSWCEHRRDPTGATGNAVTVTKHHNDLWGGATALGNAGRY